MALLGSRFFAVVVCATLAAPVSALAQGSGSEQKPPDQQKSQAAPGEPGKAETQKRTDEIAEAGRLLTGPAANPECVWLGRRVVRLLSQDDLDTAFRHLDIYDRFGCPGNHVQATFRCLLKQGIPDAKATDTLNARVHACWVNPAMNASAAAAAPAAAGPATAAPAVPPAAGTTTR